MTEENIVNNEIDDTTTTNNHQQQEHVHEVLPEKPLKMILEISSNSTIEKHILNVLRKHYLEQKPIPWKPMKIELVVNTELTDDFFNIRKKFEKFSDGNRMEFDECYGFLIENDSQLTDICQNGYQCMETNFNVLGHSKSGVYVCKYADVCIRQASARRNGEGCATMKLLVFKFVQGKQTAALVRKGPKLQPIGPTPQFTSHCSVITPKETDDLEKQFDQSQIFLYELDGREAIKRPRHCLPYAIVTLTQDGTLWPEKSDESNIESDILDTDTLRVIALSDDPLLQNKLKENVELAEAATRALEHVYEEEPPPPPPQLLPPTANEEDEQQQSLSSSNSEPIPSTATTVTSDGASNLINNESNIQLSPTTSNESHLPKSPGSTVVPANHVDGLSNSAIPLPPPPPSSSSSSTSVNTTIGTAVSTAKTPATSVATTMPLAHSAAAIQAAYRQQTGLLGALPNVSSLRGVPGAVYATTAGLTNGLNGQIIYGGVSADALRAYQPGATSAASPYVFATHAGQTIQQQSLYAAQLQAVAQQQQAAQLAAAVQQQQQQQQQQQNLIGGIPAGYMLVRTSNGGYALLAQSSAATALQSQAQAQASLAQQQYISLNAAGQPTATGARVPVGMMNGQAQQLVYQYAGQPTIQAAPTQYVQVPANYTQHQQPSTSPVMQTATTSGAAQVYTNQTPTQYIGAPQPANATHTNGTSSNSSSIVTSPSSIASQPTSTLISPQKQSAASATAAALQQQQQYQHASYSQQQQSTNGAHANNAYYAALAQAQVQQQQQQMNLISQVQYANQQGVPQQMYYTTPGGQTIYQAAGQNYVFAQAAPTMGVTTTGAPVIYSAGPVLHNGSSQQQNSQASSQSQQQQQQQAYQMLSAAATNANITTQQQAAAGVVAQQPQQLVQRSNVIPQVRHHPYRS